MGRTLLLVGRPGVGKTTVIKAVAKALGPRAGGFFTEEIRAEGRRVGFRLVTLDGKSVVMAHVGFRGRDRPRVSRYGVDVDAIEQVGVESLRRATHAGQIIVVDEIGKMELYCEPFKAALTQAVSSSSTVLATAMAKPNPWADAFKALPLVTVWEVTRENRGGLAKQVLHWLESQGLPRHSQ
jgi:nucleoside-triphosphatase